MSIYIKGNGYFPGSFLIKTDDGGEMVFLASVPNEDGGWRTATDGEIEQFVSAWLAGSAS